MTYFKLFAIVPFTLAEKQMENGLLRYQKLKVNYGLKTRNNCQTQNFYYKILATQNFRQRAGQLTET